MSETVKCPHCRTELPLNHSGPCPNCGNDPESPNLLIKVVNELVTIPEEISKLKRWSREFLEQYRERHEWARRISQPISILVSVVCLVIGLLLYGPLGAVLGFLLSILWNLGSGHLHRLKPFLDRIRKR